MLEQGEVLIAIDMTARAGEVGLAISLIDYEDYHHFKVIEKKSKIKLERDQGRIF